MLLYAYDTPNGRKISIALEEMGLPYEVRVVDITQGEQHAAEFVKISPNNKIPALVDPDGPGGRPIGIFESGAILIYLAETQRLYGVMDRRLAGHAHFAGAAVSIADFAILGWAWRHARHQIDLAEFPHVQRWYQALMARPGVARGFAVPLRRA